MTLSPIQRSKLVIALQMDDIVSNINTALRTRKATLTLDYSEDHSPRLFLARPGVSREMIMLLNTRKHAYYTLPPTNNELHAIYTDLRTRLNKLDAYLALTEKRPKAGPRIAALQVQVFGVGHTALTLSSTAKGTSKVEHIFTLPDGTIP